MTKATLGRPRLKNPRTKGILLKLTKAEHAEVLRLADGRPLAAFLRVNVLTHLANCPR
jgi:hypothetical protein